MNTKKLYRTLVLQYLKYKDSPYYSFSIYIGILVICTGIIIYGIIPQIRNWFSIQEEIAETKDRIAVMNENIQLLQSLSDAQLDSDFQTATNAYPPERDISSLISAINYASFTSGVGLEDFTFQGGEISSRSTKNSRSQDEAEITFSVSGTFPQISALLAALQERIPLLSIKEVNAQFEDTNTARVTVRYYYKSFPLITRDNTTPLKDITSENKELLKQLRSWETPEDTLNVPVGSASGSSPF